MTADERERLIAAAPGLLKFCQDLKGWLDTHHAEGRRVRIGVNSLVVRELDRVVAAATIGSAPVRRKAVRG